MAKYSKAAGKSVKSAVKRMKKGTLTSGNSDKKVTSKKQAIAIGLSEAREKGAKVPAKKAAPKKKAAVKKAAPKKKTAAKKAAPKKAAAKKKTAAKKKAAAKKTSPKKAVPKKKAAPKKSAVAKKATISSPARKKSAQKTKTTKSIPRRSSPNDLPSTSKAKMPDETSDTGEFIDAEGSNPGTEPVTNADVNNEVTPEAKNDEAVFSGTLPDQQYMPRELKTSPHDSHGNINPSKAQTSVKPSGKKPLWDHRK